MKKRTKKAWSLLLALAMLVSILLPVGVAPVQAAQSTCNYEVNSDGTITIVDLPVDWHNSGIAEIPETIDGYTVTALAWDLYTGGIVHVSVPGTVKEIPRYLFRNSDDLQTVTLENGVETIGEDAFYNASALTSVTLPDTLKEIGGGAFMSCTALATLDLPASLETIRGNAFSYTKLTDVVVPDSVSKVGAQAFRGCHQLRTVTLPAALTTIEARLFQDADALETVTIPASVTTIGEDAFDGCESLRTVCYGGTEAQWETLMRSSNTASGNDVLDDVTVICEGGSVTPPDEPDDPASTIPTPVNLEATSTQDGVQLAWDVPLSTGADWTYDGFDILSRTAGATYFKKVTHVDDFTTDYLDTKVTDGVTYEYVVCATNGNETGETSALARLTYDANAHHSVGMNGTTIHLYNQGFGSGQYRPVDKLWLTTGSEGMRITLVFDEPLQDEDVSVTVSGGGQTFQGTAIEILHQQLMFTLTLTGGKHLEPDTTYTAKVLDARGNVLAQTSFESAGAETQSWGFTNKDASYDYADLVRYYPSSIADKLYSLDKSHGEDGLCFGMALAAGLWKEGRMPDVQGGHELLNTMSWNTMLGSGQWRGVSVQDYIQAANALQFSQPYAHQTRANMNDYDGLERAVKSGEPVVIGTWIGDNAGHAVLAYDYEDKGNAFIIYVQDPQCMPHQICTLTLKGASGHRTGWTYERRGVTETSDGADDPDMTFSWRALSVTPDDDFDVDSVLADLGNNISNNVSDDLENIWDGLVGGANAAFTPLSGTSLGWIDASGTITMADLDDAVELTDSEKSVSIEGTDAAFDLDGGIAEATVSGNGTLRLVCTVGDTTITFRGTAADGVSLVREADGVRFTGADSGSIVVEEGNATTQTTTVTPGQDISVSLDGEIAEEPDALPFTDVRAGDWFYDPVRYVYLEGLMTGTSTTTFAPNTTTTRAMIVSILHRLEGEPNVGGRYSFEDVPWGSWYSQAVLWAERRGIVSGYSDERFGPNDPITREQMAAILYNYTEYAGGDTSARADLSGYSDASEVSGWASDALSWANAEGLINGMTADTLAPKASATRAQVAAILERYLSE